MPSPTTPAARKAALATPKAAHERTSPLAAYPYDGVRVLAHEAVGLKQFSVVAPRTLESALSPCPTGPTSIEFAPAYAVPGDVERIVFDKQGIGEQTRQINLQAERDAAEAEQKARDEAADAAEQELRYEQRNRQRDERTARYQMGDFRDDEGGHAHRRVSRHL